GLQVVAKLLSLPQPRLLIDVVIVGEPVLLHAIFVVVVADRDVERLVGATELLVQIDDGGLLLTDAQPLSTVLGLVVQPLGNVLGLVAEQGVVVETSDLGLF